MAKTTISDLLPKPDPFKRFDGTGRKPRAVQKQFLEWLLENWHSAQVLGGQLPVGSGKSAIARAIQIAFGARVITPSNVLINQYVEAYPKVNFLKGKTHYQCVSGLKCSEWTDVLAQKPCHECPYAKCKKRAESEATFFNPMSLYYFNMRQDERPKVIVVDEAHQLGSMALMLASKKFRKSLYKFDERCTSELYLVDWVKDQLAKLGRLSTRYQEMAKASEAAKDKLAEIVEELESVGLLKQCLEDDPQNFAIYFEDGKYRGRPEQFLVVRPVRAPRVIMRNLLDCDKLILLSGTLLPSDVEDLSAGRTVKVCDLPSPIPKERRPILYRPVDFKMNYQTDPKIIVKAIEVVLEEFPGNAIIHTTYSMARRLFPHFRRRVLTNSPEDKLSTLRQFIRTGGIFLAAGCAEGIDLKDDLCRVNIVPQLLFANLGDPVVTKRRALEGGRTWYALETLKTTIQQAGRSTRHERDRSTTIVLDPNFGRLVREYKSQLPASFLEAIQWTR